MGSLAHAHWTRDGSVELRFPYDPRFIEILKCSVPADSRTWDPAAKVWAVEVGYAAYAVNLLRQRFPDAVVVDIDAPGDSTRRPDPIRPSDEYFRRLHLLPSAPPCVVEASYRALAKAHHPDHLPPAEREHGNAAMVKINEAFAQLRDRGAA